MNTFIPFRDLFFDKWREEKFLVLDNNIRVKLFMLIRSDPIDILNDIIDVFTVSRAAQTYNIYHSVSYIPASF